MDLNHVASFVRVVETGSFTAAARALDLPKSSVSRSVARLEGELGVVLLRRTTRKLHLTDAGRVYYERARAALGELESASCDIADLGNEPRGTVRVTAPVDMAVDALSGIFADFLRQHPKVRLEVVLSSRALDLVEEGIDLALRVGTLRDSSLVARKVGSVDLGLFASKTYLKRRGAPRALAELASHDCVLFRAGRNGAKWKLHGPNGEESVHVNGPVDADDMIFTLSAVQAGIGIGLLPLFRCAKMLKIERVLPEYALRGSNVYVVAPGVRRETAAVAALREHMIERLLRLPWNHPFPGRARAG
jgi:DNA-binding transcriptional LysR family regulator